MPSTINARMSSSGTLGPFAWMPPVADGPGVDQADRQQISGTYAGIPAAASGRRRLVRAIYSPAGGVLVLDLPTAG